MIIINRGSSNDIAKRFIQIGAPEKQVEVVGNIKFDYQMPQNTYTDEQLLKQQFGNRLIWVAASTHDGEDEIILSAFKEVKAAVENCLLIIIPRHIARAGSIANLCRQFNLNCVVRGAKKEITQDTDVLIVDSMGEVNLFYSLADLAFVGGSLVKTGGHNLLEPANFSLPIITGPHLFNFEAIAKLLKKQQAITIVHNQNELKDTAIKYLLDSELRQQTGNNAKSALKHNQGTTKKLIQIIDRYLQ